MGEESMEVTELRAIRRSEPTLSPAEVRRVLGGGVDGFAILDQERAIACLTSLTRTRLLYARIAELHAAGQVGYHAPVDVEATTAIAVAEALGQEGWLFPGNRHLAAFVHRGVGFERYLDHVFGNASDGAVGHQMPGFYTARDERIMSVAGPTMAHLTHAPGFCWAARRRDDASPVAVLFGEAAVETAEYHTGVNFAAVLEAPVVFVALSRGRRDPAIAETGVAYGVASSRCDGTDLFAVIQTVREALRLGAPCIVEALLDPEHQGEARLAAFLESKGAWDAGRQSALEAELSGELDEATERAKTRSAPERRTMFEHVFQEVPPHLDAQADELRRLSRSR